MVEKENVITPSADSLLEITSSKCTVTGCGRAFRNSSELRCHMAKSHREGSLKKIHGDRKIFYACPANNCVRNTLDPRKDFFPSIYRLRKHYLAKHAEKKHKCPKCDKRFGDHSTCEQHTLSCRRLFYCSCGCYYSTLLALKNHIVRKGPEHKIIGEKDSETDIFKPVMDRSSTITKSVTVPGFLFVPSLPNEIHSKLLKIKKKPSPPVTSETLQKKPVYILPSPFPSSSQPISVITKEKNKEKRFENKGPFKDQTKYIQAKYHDDKFTQYREVDATKLAKEETPTKYDKMIRFLSSKETQSILEDKKLLRKTLNRNKKLNFLRKHLGMKSFDYSKLLKLHANDDLTSPKELADMCTQTQISYSDIDQKPNQKIDTSVVYLNKETQATSTEQFFSKIEVLETSDIGMQCGLPLGTHPQKASDIQTQTDNFNLWLKNMDFSHMETQTYPLCSINESNSIGIDTYFSHMQTQTYPTEEHMSDVMQDCLADDHSHRNICLSSELSNTSTQTTSDFWFTEHLLNQNSTHTNTVDTFGFLNIDFAVEKKDKASQNDQVELLNANDSMTMFSNSFGTQTLDLENSTSSLGTQTFDVDQFLNDTSGKNNMETQTSVSFYDLIDTSLFEEFMNDDKGPSNKIDMD